jgi:hypothetical protein
MGNTGDSCSSAPGSSPGSATGVYGIVVIISDCDSEDDEFDSR